MKKEMKILIIFALVMRCSLGLQNNSIYIIVAESNLQAGTPYHLYITIPSGTVPVEIKTKLSSSTSIKQNPEEIQKSITIEPVKGSPLTIDIPASWKDGYYELQLVGSGGVSFFHQKELYLKNSNQQYVIKVTLDRPVYSAGNTVRFSALIIDERGKAIQDGELVNASVTNHNGNVIQKWLDIPSKRGIIWSELHLDQNCHKGEHFVTVSYKGIQNTYPFYVPDQAEYSLENTLFYDVGIIVPKSIDVYNNKQITALIDATYKCGKKVHGNLTLELYGKYCLSSEKCGPWKILQNKPFHGLSEITFELPSHSVLREWSLEATVIDQLTGRVRLVKQDFQMYQYQNAIEINLFHSYFTPGLPFNFQVEYKIKSDLNLSNEDGEGIPIQIHITYNKDTSSATGIPVSTVDEYLLYTLSANNSRIPVSVTPALDTWSLLIQIEVDNQTTSRKYIPRVPYNAVNQSLTLVVDDTKVKVGSVVNVDVYTTVDLKLLSFQLVSIRSYEIIHSGTLIVTGSDPRRITFPVTSDAVTHFYFIVYGVTAKGILVVDSRVFVTTLENPVEMSLNADSLQVEPGELLNFTIEANPNTLVFLKAKDTALDQLFEMFYNPLAWLLTFDPDWSLWKRAEENKLNVIQWQIRFSNSSHKQSSLFKVPRLALFTNAILQNQVAPNQTYRNPPTELNVNPDPETNNAIPSKPRKNFSPLWLWQNMTLGPEGKMTFTAQAPDRISTWYTHVYGVDEQQQIGEAKGPVIVVTKPLFVMLDLPPSLIRSEAVQIRVLVFQATLRKVNATLISRTQRFQILNETTHRVISNESSHKEVHFSEDNLIGVVSFLIAPLYSGPLEIEAIVSDEEGLTDAIIRNISIKEHPMKFKPLVYEAKEAARHGERLCSKPPLFTVEESTTVSGRLNISFQVNSINDEFGYLRVNACVRYIHKEKADLVLETELPSGFEIVDQGNAEYSSNSTQSRNNYEISGSNSKIRWYFYKIPSDFICISTLAKRTFIVYNLQPAKVTAYTSLDLSQAKRARVYYRAPSFEDI